MKRIADMAVGDRPREKLQAKGPQALSDQELLAILLGKGTKGLDVLSLAGRILKVLAERKDQPTVDDLRKLHGMGLAKATLVVAALEFARRRIRPEGLKVTFPTDALPLIQHYADRRQEHFLCVSLNGANEVIQTRVVAIGTVDRARVCPREVFADPIADRAGAVILAHNHPAGGVDPSKEDLELTQKLRAAGETLGIRVLDHIIFNERQHCSLKADGLI